MNFDIMMLLKAFLIGGILCVIAQILIDKTKLTPAYILVGYVCAGVALNSIGIYPKLVKWAGTGATVPLTGFGNTLAEGVKQAIEKDGIYGVLYGGIAATAAGITAAILFGLMWSLIFKSKNK